MLADTLTSRTPSPSCCPAPCRPKTSQRPRWHAWLAAGLAAAALGLWPALATAGMVSIDRHEVNLRRGAGTSHEAVWVVSRGYPLQVLAKRQGWLKVRDFEGDTGWVLGRLTAPKPHLVVKVETANIRNAPRTSARLIGQASYGEVLRTLARRSGWVKVRQHDGATGWVARRLLWGW